MKFSKYTIILIVMTVLFFLGFGYMLSTIDWVAAYELFTASKRLFLIQAFALMIASIVIKIFRFQLVSKYYGKRLNFRNASLIQMFGICVAMVTPGRLGEASKIYLLYRKGIQLSVSMSIMIFERLMDLFVITGIGILFAVVVVKDIRLNALLSLIIALNVVLILLIRYPRIVTKIIPKKWDNLAKHVQDLKFKGNLGTMVMIVIFTVLTWGLQAAVQWIFAMGMGIKISIFSITAILGISTVLGLLSFLPVGVGAMDFSILFLYSIIGVPAEAAISLLLVERVFGTLMPYLYALGLMYFYKIPLSRVRHLLRLKSTKFDIEREP